MFISPSTCHLAPGSLGCALRPQRLGVSALFPQASRLPRAFDFFPRGPQAGYWAQLGTERLPNQGLSRLLLNTPLPGPTGATSGKAEGHLGRVAAAHWDPWSSVLVSCASASAPQPLIPAFSSVREQVQ